MFLKPWDVMVLVPRTLCSCSLPTLLPPVLFECISYLPFEWPTHLIKPIFKSGDKTFVTNYRPISLLSVASKVLENNCIVEYIMNSISNNQFGYLRGRSTLQQLLIFFNIVHNCSSQVDVTYLDFRKAFDSVAHNELLLKLWIFGITGNLLLFLVFVNDLPDTALFSMILLFADDAKCIMPISSQLDGAHLQFDLSRLSEWCKKWSLYLNENKCSTIHFKASSSTTFNYYLKNQQISTKHMEKDLGLTVSADLN